MAEEAEGGEGEVEGEGEPAPDDCRLVGASHVPTLQGEVGVFYAVVKPSLFFAALLWLLYIALEPYVGRRAPQQLISWTRLLAGD